MWQQRTVKVYDWETETLLPLLFFSKKRNTFSRVSYNTCWVIGTVNQYAIVTSKQTAAALLAPSKWLWFSSHTASATNPTWGMLSPLKSLSQNIPVWHILEMPQLHLRHPQDPIRGATPLGCNVQLIWQLALVTVHTVHTGSFWFAFPPVT